MVARRLYVVRGSTAHGTVTYNCPTADWALRKMRDFVAAERRDITVVGPDGAVLTEADLIGIAEGAGSAPLEESLPAAPQINLQPALA
ncbi:MULTISPECIES: hypothetical protein [Methylobacterium]|jgi:hypothetical protein|uniref:DUF2849 domain-containing protein n=1 Tax=Methylobacterium longum TaxID=767694 RepID=A0ABT8AS39_9HYPH|nr:MULTISPECIES: hypothetical protein [Methylobacterium]MCJ2098872.1 hypothetical protein [Methylobacterium sp. E-046]MDN3572502.1 hypothetical protein [Methylobacterium longum]GJE09354.1 hypothetical protein FOHLNKBM_0377 [Methylobacterium longum]